MPHLITTKRNLGTFQSHHICLDSVNTLSTIRNILQPCSFAHFQVTDEVTHTLHNVSAVWHCLFEGHAFGRINIARWQSVQLSLFNLLQLFFPVYESICVFQPAAPKHQVLPLQCLKWGLWYRFGCCTVNGVLYKVHIYDVQLWKPGVICVVGL